MYMNSAANVVLHRSSFKRTAIVTFTCRLFLAREWHALRPDLFWVPGGFVMQRWLEAQLWQVRWLPVRSTLCPHRKRVKCYEWYISGSRFPYLDWVSSGASFIRVRQKYKLAYKCHVHVVQSANTASAHGWRCVCSDDAAHIWDESILTPEAVQQIVFNQTDAIMSAFPNHTVYAALGNHDWSPKSQLPPTPHPMYAEIASK